MGLRDIEAGIREKSRRQVEEIKSKTRDEISGVKNQLEMEVRDKCGKITLDSSKKSAALRRSIISNARISALNMVAVEKAKTLDSVFTSARAAVLSLLPDGKRKILSKLLVDRSLIEGRVTLLVDRKYTRLLPKLRGVEIKTQKLDDFGFILSSQDGLICVDRRLSTVLEELSERIKPELCGILFEGK
ncbi:MAG: hypothetical protein FJY77_03700 [Candidatus Altiarchaeales archaeon]|nr:hypothetical protein [Candidatus Altiarchaeales archaeon]